MSLTELEQLQAENATLRAQLDDLQQRLVQAQKLGAVGSLASSITHEFNNILTTIINYARMGVRHKQATIRDKAFDRILSSGQRAAKITTGLLSYVRNRSDRKDILSLKQLVQDILLLVEKDLQVHRIRVETRFVGEPFASVSAGQLQQVLLNLIVNGRQAMEPGGTLYVSVGPGSDPEIAEIAIRDTGCGIPTDKLQKIFDPYYTTKSVDAQGQGGTGIGLALCKDVIDAHGGRIRVESVVGRGTMFTLKLPMAPAPVLSVRPEVAQKVG
ncbi:Wide host range VirA protein [Caulifigura coniformis]|uniref:histidine kinase n=1 Tax=Caulifigura coniformis TaxID=2527983 RepID=A0A517SE95_9PLAN|nr:ATP-binding protein [Caulifigura coniformis]QDT54427.1 Wide host range VirA protein [Caulifigura coniformis]